MDRESTAYKIISMPKKETIKKIKTKEYKQIKNLKKLI